MLIEASDYFSKTVAPKEVLSEEQSSFRAAQNKVEHISNDVKMWQWYVFQLCFCS